MSEMSEDSLEPLVTQCPNCDTRFRVTESQLQVAAGRVRCGACLAVFEGTAHLSLDGETLNPGDDPDVDALLEELDEVTGGEPAEPPSLPSIGKGDLVPLSHSEMIESGDSEEGLPDELLALEAELLAEMSVMEAEPRKVSSDQQEAVDVVLPTTDIDPQQGESTHDEAVEELGEGLDEAIAEPFGIEVPESLEDSAEGTDESTEEDIQEDIQEDTEEHAVEIAAEGPVETEPLPPPETDDDTDNTEITEITEIAEDEQWLDDVADDVWQKSDADADAVSDSEEGEGKVEPESEPASEVEVIELEALSSAPEPGLTLYQDEEETKPRRSLVTKSLIVLALIGLPVQVLWFQYDAWVRDLAYRPIYETICELADCVLPPMQDVSKIVSKKSFIRAHPERDEARIVDVLMVNNAEFAQPYPLIELVATNMQGQLVAGRRFKPAEYLQGDASADDLLAPRTPVHVSLEIQDPAEQALNFEIHFR